MAVRLAERIRVIQYNSQINSKNVAVNQSVDEGIKSKRCLIILGCIIVLFGLIMGFWLGFGVFYSYQYEEELYPYSIIYLPASGSDAYYALEKDGYTVSGLKLLQSERITLRKGESITLTVEIDPADLPRKYVRWSSNDEAVAKVDQEGKVKACDYGQATVTADVGDFSVRCLISVPYENE